MSFGLMVFLSAMATIIFILWLIIFIKYHNQYNSLTDKIDGKIFTLKDIYFIGLGCIEIYEKRTKEKITDNEKAVVKMKMLAEVFGRDSAGLYYYILKASMISLLFTFIPLGLVLGCIMHSFLGVICGATLVAVLVYGINNSINASIKRKKEDILDEFPKMVSKLTLLINAGMIVRKAWDEVAYSNFSSNLYEEMRNTSKDINEGLSIESAMDSFANRCGLKEIRKFSSIYVQCIKRGAADSINSMKTMSDEAWERKKQISKQKGEIAAQKLMLPTMIMFVGILMVVVVPMVASMLGTF